MGQILFSFFLRERGEHPGVGTQRLTTKWEKNKQTKTGNKKGVQISSSRQQRKVFLQFFSFFWLSAREVLFLCV